MILLLPSASQEKKICKMKVLAHDLDLKIKTFLKHYTKITVPELSKEKH